MTATDRPGPRWAVTAIGVALLLAVTVSPLTGQPATPLVHPTLGSLLALGVVAVGVALVRSPFATWHLHVAAGWTAAGAIVMAAAGAWTIGMFIVPADTAQAVIGFDLAAGGLAGSLVGAMSARSRHRAHQLAEERERLAFLNYLLRHNVRNGVQVVTAQTESLRDAIPPHAERRVEVIESWTRGIGDVVGRMRQFLDTSAGDTDLCAVPVTDVIDAEAAKVEGAFDVDITTTGSEPTVQADDGLHQVFECLLVDAVERTDVDDPTITVTTSQRGHSVLIEVATPDPVASADGGCAFAPDPDADPAGDLGFGRYLVATLVEYYGGTVDLGEHDDVLYTIELPQAAPT